MVGVVPALLQVAVCTHHPHHDGSGAGVGSRDALWCSGSAGCPRLPPHDKDLSGGFSGPTHTQDRVGFLFFLAAFLVLANSPIGFDAPRSWVPYRS